MAASSSSSSSAEAKVVNPLAHTLASVEVEGKTYKYYSLAALKDKRLDSLPISIKVLLESALRNADGFNIKKEDVECILDWQKTSKAQAGIPWKPARVLLQDFTGVPAVVDLAAMRDAMARLGGDPSVINPVVPAELVVDHSVQVDSFRRKGAVAANLEMEMKRNHERFAFLKWGAKAFKRFSVVPPGSGIVHQVNVEHLARVVFETDGVLYPDSLCGTDSHSTMVNGLGVVGWGVGGLEAESTVLGQTISMVLPEVVGYRLVGKLPSTATATDLVLTITQNLRKVGVVGKFVEFFGPGLADLSLADRLLIANMAPECGSTVCFFPADKQTIDYMTGTDRGDHHVKYTEAYLRAQGMFVDDKTKEPTFSATLELDLSSIVPCVAGPKRPHDRVPVSDMKRDFRACLEAPVGFKGFALSAEERKRSAELEFEGKKYTLNHGDVVIAAITSCTNTSNPSVMLGAGLLAKRAVERGLTTRPFIKTSLAPGSGVVTKYLERSGLQPFLDQLGFSLVGYGCTTCIGNSGDLYPEVAKAIETSDLVASAVLSGNRNFEGRVHQLTRANYLASPPLVVAYAIAGTLDFDFEKTPLGKDKDGKDVFLREIWPSGQEVQELVANSVTRAMFKEVYASITKGTDSWNALAVSDSILYPWDAKSTYIHHPPFFQTMTAQLPEAADVVDAYCLLNLGDSITTDHISPAGKIARNSPAARYLEARGVAPRDFNTYGARRGNDEVMARGTFANVRLVNKFLGGKKGSPKTLHVPTGEILDVFDAADRYIKAKADTIILGGRDYGSGSSRDWAAKGPYLQGVKAVIAVSYERIHRSNLVGMGLLPLQYRDGEDAETLGLTGKEQFSIKLTGAPLKVGQELTVKVKGGKEFNVVLRLDTEVELAYYRHGGILQYVIRSLLPKKKE